MKKIIANPFFFIVALVVVYYILAKGWGKVVGLTDAQVKEQARVNDIATTTGHAGVTSMANVVDALPWWEIPQEMKTV